MKRVPLPDLKKPTERPVALRQGLFTIPDRARDKPNLIGSKCSNCGLVAFPKKLTCARCLSSHSKDILLSREGRVDSFTVVRVDLPGLKAPYIWADVKLPEGPIVTSQIIGCAPSESEFSMGDRVELTLVKVAEDEHGKEVLDYRFRLLKR